MRIFDTLNYELYKLLHKQKKLKDYWLQDELGGKIIAEFVGLIAKTYSYLRDDNNESNKQKAQKVHNKKKTYI